MSCGRITQGSVITECDDLPQSGTRARLILLNYEDVRRIYTNDDGKIVEIELAPNTNGYEFTGLRNDVRKSEESQKTTQNKKRFAHRCGFVIYEVDQIQKLNIKDIARGRFIAIVESKGEDEDSIELLGRDCGLAIVGGQIRNAHETNGVFVINLSTPDNGIEFEKKLPQTIGTSYQNGIDIIEGLLTPSDGIFDDTFDSTFE